jgi:hypothetical protein
MVRPQVFTIPLAGRSEAAKFTPEKAFERRRMADTAAQIAQNIETGNVAALKQARKAGLITQKILYSALLVAAEGNIVPAGAKWAVDNAHFTAEQDSAIARRIHIGTSPATLKIFAEKWPLSREAHWSLLNLMLAPLPAIVDDIGEVLAAGKLTLDSIDARRYPLLFRIAPEAAKIYTPPPRVTQLRRPELYLEDTERDLRIVAWYLYNYNKKYGRADAEDILKEYGALSPSFVDAFIRAYTETIAAGRKRPPE